jgi:flagella basal body P-ring formation protein FlgA
MFHPRGNRPKPRRRRSVAAWLTAIALVHAASSVVGGAVIRLKSEVACRSVLLELGDVADVAAANEGNRRELEAVALGLAPGAGKVQFLDVDEIKSQLRRRGVNLAEHQFQGASRVRLLGPASEPKPRRIEATAGAPGSREQAQAERILQTAVRRLLARAGVEEAEALAISVDIPAAMVQEVARRRPDELAISGGSPPWTGRQQFSVRLTDGGNEASLPFSAEIRFPQQVVVARRRVPRGLAIEAGDVELRPLDGGGPAAGGFSRLEDVIGKEAANTLEPGRLIAERDVRSIPLVRRGEVVTVVVRGPGFTVKRLARARDEAAQGETVSLVTLEGRKQFVGEVVGVREVEIPWRGGEDTQ